jgi:hypothetical protein
MFSMETVTRNGNCLFRRFRPFVAFEGIQNKCGCLLIKEIVTKHKRKVQCTNIEITAVSEIYTLSATVYFVSVGQIKLVNL